jgi:RNA polymerase sigma factor (sigma-70 family)
MLRTTTATTIYFRKLVSNCGKPTLSLEETQNSALGCIGWLLIQPLPNTERKTSAYEAYDKKEEEQLQLMYAAIKSLNDIDKALIFLYLEDKNYQEISETLGITEVNARVKMNRIKKKLKKILKP